MNSALTVTASFTPTTSTRPDLVVTSLVMPSIVTRNVGFPMSFNVVNLGASVAAGAALRRPVA